MQLNKQKIIRLINQNIEKLKQKYPIKSIALYVSYARGEQDSSSDIDLLVDFTQPIRNGNYRFNIGYGENSK